MALIFLIVFCNALSRYLFGDSLAWGGQIPVFLGVYGVMFGMAVAYIQDRHVRLGIIVDFIPEKPKRMLFMVVDLSVVVIGVLMSWSGYLFMTSRGSMRISGMIDLANSLQALTGVSALKSLATMAPYQFAIVLGGAMLAIAAILKFIERLGKALGNEGNSAPAREVS
ncbi:tripartite ATP-independent transporter DctQ subunit [Chromohalobacter marismortui]|uniref:TRAP transporter small permease protein n=2 Tax=Chromohalobacter TaxID=42054 RepID=A0A4R7NN26_9GAMM|nr:MULTISPECIES: TRAP transporter small permease [Chromohalobacter]MCI0509717.1 TRAP transporter small permease subunit [Chromohalobacter sp.]TDU21939.1 tripartite ATP-independent transporter DctQ subunit [Chromohalobacter marismortui]